MFDRSSLEQIECIRVAVPSFVRMQQISIAAPSQRFGWLIGRQKHAQVVSGYSRVGIGRQRSAKGGLCLFGSFHLSEQHPKVQVYGRIVRIKDDGLAEGRFGFVIMAHGIMDKCDVDVRRHEIRPQFNSRLIRS